MCRTPLHRKCACLYVLHVYISGSGGGGVRWENHLKCMILLKNLLRAVHVYAMATTCAKGEIDNEKNRESD